MLGEFKWSDDPRVRENQYHNEIDFIEELFTGGQIDEGQRREMVATLQDDYLNYDSGVPADDTHCEPVF